MGTTENASLRMHLSYEPRELRFGTSGRRGEVLHLSQLEIYINALGELRYLQSLPVNNGGIVPGEEFYLAHDLRFSSTHFDQNYGGRGEILQIIAKAAEDAGMRPVNLGAIPTPALTYYALSRAKGSVMVTGSHIPFDRNGYKLNTSQGELLKKHEQPVNESVQLVRERIYAESADGSIFNATGTLKDGHRELPQVERAGRDAYVRRYTRFFTATPLSGLKILLYQHSAVGRDILPEILGSLGAEVVCAGRSETFVPIDTEAIDDTRLSMLQELADSASAQHGSFDAVVSTDGDSDRPLLLGFDLQGKVHFFSGDLLGMIVAEFLDADAVVVPVTCNDAVDLGPLAAVLEPKTRIGSPYVIEGMEKALQKGRQRVCGWEANGGFLTGSDIKRDGAVLHALPTRDAVLPIVCALAAARKANKPLLALFDALPPRFSRASLAKSFPRADGLAIIRMLSPSRGGIRDVFPATGNWCVQDFEGQAVPHDKALAQEISRIVHRLEMFFPSQRGFGTVTRLNYIDGVRIWFGTGEVIHLRPSGNADEMRFYAVADNQDRADELARSAVAEQYGVIHLLRETATTSMHVGGRA
jgi:phosphomannomutase